MKPLAFLLLVASVVAGVFTYPPVLRGQERLPLDVWDLPRLEVPITAATASSAEAPPVVVMAPTTVSPEAVEAKILKWLAVAGTVGTAFLALVAMLWSKVNELRERMNRQSQKTGALQQQMTSIALATAPPGPEAGEPTGGRAP